MNRNDGAVGDARKARESARLGAGDVEALALDEELCRYDDSLHHMEGTDDFPCWHCKAKARDVITSDWLARVIADAKAEAWDEGYVDRHTHGPAADIARANPYREAAR